MADPTGTADESPRSTPYQVVARRFRPKAFDEVVGQEQVVGSLRSSLQQKRIPHAYLFAGSRGVGKTTTARILARCLNCEQGPTPEPCGTCALCKSLLDGSNPDVIEIDAASHNGVDDVRMLREAIGYAAMLSRYKVFILDEAHMMSRSAWNALLKTLEEPPPNVVFILATTESHKIPETIRSRCQVQLFRRIGDSDIVQRLRTIAQREGVAIADEVLAEIALSSRGGMRDSETALERVLPLAKEQGGTFDLAAWRTIVQRVGIDAAVDAVAELLRGNAGAALRFAQEMQQTGVDEREGLGELIEILRALLLLRIDGADTGLVAATGALRERYRELAAGAQPQQLDAMIQAALLGRERLRRLEDRGVVLELTLVRMAQAGALQNLADLVAEVRAGGGGAPAATARPAAPASPPRFGKAPGAPTGPVPAAAAPVPPLAGGVGVDLRGQVLARMQDRALLQATLQLCRFEGPNAQGKVTVRLDTDKRMHIDRLSAPPLQQEITGIIQQALGSAAAVEFALPAPGTTGGAAATGSPTAPSAVPPGPATQRVVGKFGGRIVAVNPEDRRRLAAEPPPVDDSPPAGEPPADA
ncbi:MAG: DNA polymerase III subunit gamma/tau [Planctomycetes bacterium]|nr:DNA polymerase III subunit gamma/tau [Planctomycetota bacterium]